LVHRFPAVEGGLGIEYRALPLVQSILLASHLRDGRSPIPFFLVSGLAGVLGCGLYHFLPVVGPDHVFGESFRTLAKHVVPAALTIPLHQTPRNGIPSLHFTWALLIFWNVLPSHRTGRILAAGFVLLTGLATIGLGEHYLVDLIVAVPFAFGVQSLCLGRRRNAAISGLIALAWMFYLRLGIQYLEPVPAISWLASGITVFTPVILNRITNRSLSRLVGPSPALSTSPLRESPLH